MPPTLLSGMVMHRSTAMIASQRKKVPFVIAKLRLMLSPKLAPSRR